MKKIFFSLIAPLCLLGVLVLPESGFAFMTTLSETGMRSATAQAGILLSATESVALRMEIDTIAYGDAGLDLEKDSGAYLSVNDIFLEGSITINEPVRVGVTTEQSPYTGRIETGVNISFRDIEIDIDRFEIGSITVGANPGEGASFGRVVVEDFYAKISGDIRITTN